MAQDPRLTQLLCARLCHDLGGAIGTVTGMLDLLDVPDAEALGVARDAATELRRRLRLYAAAWGQSALDLQAHEVADLLAGSPSATRVRFLVEPFLPAKLPAHLVPLVLNAALLASEALPRGGVVHVTGGSDAGLAVWPDGTSAAWPKELLVILSGTAPEAVFASGPRRVIVPYLSALSAQAGWEMSLGLGAGQGAAPLLLMPRRG